MAAGPRLTARPRFFDTELRETAPTSPLFFVTYLFLVFTLWWIGTHLEHLLLSMGALFSLLAALLAAGPESWTNPVEWETRWEASGFAARQRRLEAHTRRLVALTAKYATAFSTVALFLFLVGIFIDLPAPVVVLVVGGLIVTVIVTAPLCLISGLVSGALLPAWLRDDEPARFAVLAKRMTPPADRSHAACASVGATVAAFVFALLSFGS